MPPAFKPTCARIKPPSAQEHWPPRPRRSRGKAVARPIVVAMDRRHRRRAAATIARQCCEFCEHRSPHFRCAADPVSAKESDRLFAVAHPNAADSAAVGIDVLRCRRPGRNHPAGFTKGATVHSLVVNGCTLFLPLLIGATVRPYASCRSESSLHRLDRRVGMGPSRDVVIVDRPHKLSFGHAAATVRGKFAPARARISRCVCATRPCKRGCVPRSRRSHCGPAGWWSARRCGFPLLRRRP